MTTPAVKKNVPRIVGIFQALPLLREECRDDDEDEDGMDKGKAFKPEVRETKKKDIPTPIIHHVKEYEQEQPATFPLSVGYIRYSKHQAANEEDFTCSEYDLELEDHTWLRKHPVYGLQQPGAGKLDGPKLERMIDVMEKATGMGGLVLQPQAEALFVSKLGMSKVEHEDVWNHVYAYWKAKRQKLGKSLLRRFWPVTSPGDTDPHKVFRPREKERYKLRRNRKNDTESYRKMQQLKRDFTKMLDVLGSVRSRERLKQAALLIQRELFEQALYDLTDTSGRPRPPTIKLGEFKLKLGEYDDVLGAGDGGEGGDKSKKKKKSKKGGDGGGSRAGDGGEDEGTSAPKLFIAVLPSFMDALATRDTELDIHKPVQPQLPSYTVHEDKARVEPVFKFRCRGRVGRGGRVVFDRVPCPQASASRSFEKTQSAPTTVIYTGSVVHPFSAPKVFQLQPPFYPANVNERQVRDICAMEEDQDELLEPLGLGVAGAVDVQKPPGTTPVLKYSIAV